MINSLRRLIRTVFLEPERFVCMRQVSRGVLVVEEVDNAVSSTLYVNASAPLVAMDTPGQRRSLILRMRWR